MPTPVMVNSRSPIPVHADRMTRIETRIADLDKQIASGERFTEAAQDPGGASRAAMLTRMGERIVAEEKALARAEDRLSLSETAIVTARDAILRAKELTLIASNGTSSAETRAVLLAEVKVLGQQLLDAANTRDEAGRHIFGGSRNATAPYVADADGVVQWKGFASAAGAEAAGIGTATPPAGPSLFGDAVSGTFAQLRALEEALVEPDAELRKVALEGVLAGLDPSHERLVIGQATVGAGRARLAFEGDRVATAKLANKEAMAAVKGLDLTEAIVELEALKTTLAAAQASFTRIFDGTLFDRLG